MNREIFKQQLTLKTRMLNKDTIRKRKECKETLGFKVKGRDLHLCNILVSVIILSSSKVFPPMTL